MKTIDELKAILIKQDLPAILYVKRQTRRDIESISFSGPGLKVRKTKLALFVNAVRIIENNKISTPWEIKQ